MNVENAEVELATIIRKYELQCDIGEFLTLIAKKSWRKLNSLYVDANDTNKPFMNYIVLSYMGLIVLNTAAQSLNHFQNVYGIKSSIWDTFIDSAIYEATKINVSNTLKELDNQYTTFINKVNPFVEYNRLPKDFRGLFDKSYEKSTYEEIKDIYRKVTSLLFRP